MWLPGGASNTGGGVLMKYFTVEQMKAMDRHLDSSTPTGLDYYPLCDVGERFPIADPNWPVRLEPRPKDDAVFYQAMLEGIGEIERVGYAALAGLGAPHVNRVFTSGGGASNNRWTEIRASKLGVPIIEARSTDAAVGSARIAAFIQGACSA
jgi:sugar (pentulose or hexulose) kinase